MMKSFIGVGGQIGMGGGGDVFRPLLAECGDVLNSRLRPTYSEDLEGLLFVLRVDGNGSSGWVWHESGVKRLRLLRKRDFVTADICFQVLEYENTEPTPVRRLFFERLRQAIDASVQRIKKDKLNFDEGEFRRDLQIAYAELAEKWGLS